MSKIKAWLKRYKRYVIYAVSAVVVLGFMIWPSAPEAQERTLTQIQGMVAQHQVREAKIFEAQSSIQVRTDKGTFTATFLADSGDRLTEQLEAAKVPYKVESDDRGWLARNFGSIIFYLLMLTLIMGPMLLAKGGKGIAGSIIGKTDYAAERPKERFTDVVGAEEAIGHLQGVIDFLREPEKYEGVRIERGILFEGPTGTGKTMLAKALAGELGLPFYHLSGAGLSSVWSGGTSERIERFFAKLIKETSSNQGAIVFIDELDGIASKRGGEHGADRDRNTSVTQLLHQVSMLFDKRPCIILVAATNRIENLDEAIIRPGRFGLHIAMPNPDRKARLGILQANAGGLGDDANLVAVADITAGMSGADLASIPHRAAALSRRNGAESTQRLLEQAAMEAAFGTLRHSVVLSPEDQQGTAVHESGHSLVAHLSPYHSLRVATIIPIKESGGSTWCPPIDHMVMTREGLMWNLMVWSGGQEAELLDVGQASSGAAHDIQNATDLALEAICRWGIFDGFVTSIDTRYWQEHPQAGAIQAKLQELLDEASKKARRLLTEYEVLRRLLQEELKEKRILHSDELAELTAAHPLKPELMTGTDEPVRDA